FCRTFQFCRYSDEFSFGGHAKPDWPKLSSDSGLSETGIATCSLCACTGQRKTDSILKKKLPMAAFLMGGYQSGKLRRSLGKITLKVEPWFSLDSISRCA